MKSRKRNRMLDFDYSQEAVYFVTSCCKDRICYFGEIKNQQMILNKYGQIVQNQIQWLEKQYPYVELHNFVVMPNHIHILFEINRINNNPVRTNHIDERTGREYNVRTGREYNVGTGRDLSLQHNTKTKSVSSLMGALKTTTSKQIHLLGNLDFNWQRSFHDHIVRDAKRYDHIFNYITDNPARWNDDLFNEETNPNYNETT